MLTNLAVSNLVLIDKVNLDFGSGFTVLTGETGAGKSILLDALSLALGKRSDSKLVKQGSQQASIIAVFDVVNNKEIKKLLVEQGIDFVEELILRRVVNIDGKSRAFINDQPISLSFLKQVADCLIEIHGQHDNADLFSASMHRNMLDDFADNEKLLSQVKKDFFEWKSAEKRLFEIQSSIEKIKQEEDYLRHIFEELKKLDPRIGEEEKLAEHRKKLLNKEKIVEGLSVAISEIKSEKSGANNINNAIRALIKTGENFSTAIEALERALNEIEDARVNIEKSYNDLTSSENNLTEIDDRYFALKEASRKYRKTVDELPAFINELESKLKYIDADDTELKKLKAEVEEKKTRYKNSAAKLSEERIKAAIKLEKEVQAELEPLKMGSAKFKVEISELLLADWSENGIDKVNFLVQTNSGTGFGHINKIASGGELSRFMLALKVVLQSGKSVPTMIFDEIDAGVGGAVADAIGKRLAKLGKKIQTMAVTHLPQVAAAGNNHFLIEKTESAESTKTFVKKLSDKEKQNELARMLAGEKITAQARALASELIGAK